MDYFDYDEFTLADSLREDFGLLVHCKGGGGGSSGEVDYPSYMKTQHGTWLSQIATAISSTSSPYIGEAAYDPDPDISAMIAAVGTFSTAVTALSYISDWDAAISAARTKMDTIVDDVYLNQDIAAYAATLDDDINDEVLPQFQAGMRDINAVQTSAFVLGEAKIWAAKTKQINKYASSLRIAMQQQRNTMIMDGTKSILHNLDQSITMKQALASMTVEAYRIKIVAKKEQTEADLDITVQDALWPLEKYQHGANMMASIGGGTATTTGTKPSKSASAIGGALSGAAAGAMVGSAVPGIGTAVGAGVGAVMGGLGGLLQ